MSTKSMSAVSKAVLAIVVLLPSVFFFLLYQSVGWRYSDLNETDKADTFIHYFPGFMQNASIVYGISVVCCLAAIIIASGKFKKKVLAVRILRLVAVVAAILLLLFDFTQLI